RAGVGGGHQLDTGGERHRQPPAGDDYLAFFEGLAEGVERPGGELAELVEEENPVCGEGDLSGHDRTGSSPDQGGEAGRVMRRPKRRGVVHASAPSRSRPHTGRLEGLLVVERREQPSQPACQHRLAGPGWTVEEQVMAPGGGYLQSPAGERLPANVGQVGDRRTLAAGRLDGPSPRLAGDQRRRL